MSTIETAESVDSDFHPIEPISLILKDNTPATLEISLVHMQDNYTQLAIANGCEASDAIAFFESTKFLTDEPANKGILSNIIQGQIPNHVLGWVDLVDNQPELGVLPVRIARSFIEDPYDAAQLIQKIGLTTEEVLLHELSHLLDLQLNPEEFKSLLTKRRQRPAIGLTSMVVGIPLATNPATLPLGIATIGAGIIVAYQGAQAQRQIEAKVSKFTPVPPDQLQPMVHISVDN